MRKYLVISIEDVNDFYIIDSLDKLINEMYEPELDSNSFNVVEGWFYETHKVFVINGNIEEQSN
jgi:hypothetical protein